MPNHVAGQAVLSLAGVAGADVHICLPPSLSITATHSGGIDCRLQLLGVLAEWPGAKQHQQQPLLQPARSSAAGFIMRCGALLLAHALFPDHTSHLLARMAVPVALADAAAAVSSTIPPAVRQAVRQRASRAKHRLQRTGSISRGGLDSGCDVGWIDVSGGVLTGAMHTLRSLTGVGAGKNKSQQQQASQEQQTMHPSQQLVVLIGSEISSKGHFWPSTSITNAIGCVPVVSRPCCCCCCWQLVVVLAPPHQPHTAQLYGGTHGRISRVPAAWQRDSSRQTWLRWARLEDGTRCSGVSWVRSLLSTWYG